MHQTANQPSRRSRKHSTGRTTYPTQRPLTLPDLPQRPKTRQSLSRPLQRPDKREAEERFATLLDMSRALRKENKGSSHGKCFLTKTSKSKCRRWLHNTRSKSRSRILLPSPLPTTLIPLLGSSHESP